MAKVQQNTLKLKVTLLGNMAVGKTCLARRFVSNTFIEEHVATISDIETKTIEINGRRVVFQIWDTAGQERFRALMPMYMKGIDGAVVVYDVTSKKTAEDVAMWISEVRKNSEEAVIILVGNKTDLVVENEERRKVFTEDGAELADNLNVIFTEASARTGDNVDGVFMELGSEIIKRKEEKRIQQIIDESTYKIYEDLQKPPKKNTCCS